MLKELLALNEEATVSREMQQNFNRTATAVRKVMKPYFEQKEQVRVTPLSEKSAKFAIEFNYWMRPEAIVEAHNEFEDAIRKSDENGHIQTIREGDSTGEHYVEAMLGGLRRGMKAPVIEAFFPTMEKIVTWSVVTRRPKK
jgi:hypothetical protein